MILKSIKIGVIEGKTQKFIKLVKSQVTRIFTYIQAKVQMLVKLQN